MGSNLKKYGIEPYFKFTSSGFEKDIPNTDYVNFWMRGYFPISASTYYRFHDTLAHGLGAVFFDKDAGELMQLLIQEGISSLYSYNTVTFMLDHISGHPFAKPGMDGDYSDHEEVINGDVTFLAHTFREVGEHQKAQKVLSLAQQIGKAYVRREKEILEMFASN